MFIQNSFYSVCIYTCNHVTLNNCSCTRHLLIFGGSLLFLHQTFANFWWIIPVTWNFLVNIWLTGNSHKLKCNEWEASYKESHNYRTNFILWHPYNDQLPEDRSKANSKYTYVYQKAVRWLSYGIVKTINGPLVIIMERTRRQQQYCNEWHLCFHLAVSLFATKIYTACTFNEIVTSGYSSRAVEQWKGFLGKLARDSTPNFLLNFQRFASHIC